MEQKNIVGKRDIRLSLIDNFPNHPYHIFDDADMAELVESTKANGLLNPIIVRSKADGRYELISGHRRNRTYEILGILFMKSGRLVLSCMKLPLLVKRANKEISFIKEATEKSVKTKSDGSEEKNFVNNNPQPPKPTTQFVDENIEEYDVEDDYADNGFMSILNE